MIAILSCFLIGSLLNGGDPLSLWNEGENKAAILEFVSEVTQEEGPYFIPKEERIATFDQDGTLWVEKPLYAQLYFALDRVQALAKEHPEWQQEEPFKSILAGNLEDLSKFTLQDIEKILAATLSGMSVETYLKEVASWLKTAEHPRFKRPFTELVYQPMLQLIKYLQLHDFKVYIVSGGGQEFIRAYAEKVYGIPPEHVIGSAGKVAYEYSEGRPKLKKLPEVLFINDKGGKPEGINLVIGRRPIASFGNSIGDKEMLEWTDSPKGKTLSLLIYHDDEKREYAYGEDSKIGFFPNSLIEEALKRRWIVVSMKADFKEIFSPSPQK